MRPDHPHLLTARCSAGRLYSGSRPELLHVRPAVVPLPDDRRTRKLRRCLQCREHFLSADAGERVCPDCEVANARLLEGF